jgi:hypothetical protein
MSDFFNWQAQPYSLSRSAQYNQLSPHLAQFMKVLTSFYGGSNLGGHVDRPVRGGSSPSSHAFGAATDWGYTDRKKADAAINYVVANARALGIQAIHDYDRQRVWRVGRGWKAQPKGSHGGLMKPGTHHLHFEVNQANWGSALNGAPSPTRSNTGAVAGATLGAMWGAAAPQQQQQRGGQVSDTSNWAQIKQWMDGQEATFHRYLSTLPPERQEGIINDLHVERDIHGVKAYMDQAPKEVNDYIKYLSQIGGEQAADARTRLAVQPYNPAAAPGAPAAVGDPGAPAPIDPAASKAMTDLLQTLGVSYPNAPAPTPALLAFLNGIGLNLATAEDVKRRAIDRIGASATDAMADIDRTAGRTKQNVTADIVRRGVLESGEANTRYARHAEDVAESKSDVEKAKAAGVEGAETSYTSSTSALRQQALDRLIGAEQDQSAQAAQSKAQADAIKAAQDAADVAWQRQQESQNSSIARQEELYHQYGAQGVSF